MTSAIATQDRTSPYGTVGVKLAGVTDAAEALALGGLDFTVTKEQLQSVVNVPVTMDENGVTGGLTYLPFADKFATVRNNSDGTRANLGVVGNTYQPIQNAWTTDLLQNLVDSSDGVFKAVGSTHGGSKTFVQMSMPEGVTIGGRDGIDVGIVIFNSHDGSSSCVGIPTATRIFCMNQFPALKKTETKFSIQHTAGSIARWNIEEIRRAVKLTFAYAREIEEIGNMLIEREMSVAEFGAFVDKISPVVMHEVKAGRQETHASALRRLQLKDIFTGAENLDNVRGTQWAALQAVIEYEDWFRPAGKGQSHESRVVAHLGDNFKLKAQSLLLAR
jgi:phage/plasmid-like protein (TIGR03299 family)